VAGYCLIAERRAVLFSVWLRGPLVLVCTVEVWFIFVMKIAVRCDVISSLSALLVQDGSKSSCEGTGGEGGTV